VTSQLIDAHVHLYPPEAGRDPAAWAAGRHEPHWAALCARRRRDGSPVQFFPTVDELLRDMDAAGVEKSVLLGWYWENPATCAVQNRFYAECVRAHPDRLAAFATVHPAAGTAALDEIHRARGEGLIGLGELSPHSQKVAPEDPTWLAILRLAGELRLPVNLHVTDPRSRRFPGWVETPLSDFISLAREFPATTFILAHWGGSLAFDSENRALQNVFYDTAASPLLYDESAWSRGLGAVGAERILFGSDIPLRLYPWSDAGTGWTKFVAEMRSAALGESRAPIEAANARRLLRF
jgi:predicted TIM-barrel fold metal-dependent hydrolase